MVNTCSQTIFPKSENFNIRRFNTEKMSLMRAIVESEADVVRSNLGKNIIFCCSDEMFINDPSTLFEEYDFDILIGYDGISRIMNGMVCVKSNPKTAEFFDQRVEEFHYLNEELQKWGGDMHSYTKSFSRISSLFKLLELFSFPERASGKTNWLQSIIYVLAKKLKLLNKVNKVDQLKVKFFYWGHEIAKSVEITNETLEEQVKTASAQGFYLLDFKGNRKNIIGENE